MLATGTLYDRNTGIRSLFYDVNFGTVYDINAVGNRQQATGNRQQATGNRQQATGNRQQATTTPVSSRIQGQN